MANIRPKGAGFEVRISRKRADGPAVAMSKSFKTHAEARAWAHAMEAKIDRGEHVSNKAARFTFAQACDAFASSYRPKGAAEDGELSKREAQLVAAVRHFVRASDEKTPDKKDRTIASITRQTLQDFIDGMSKAPIVESAGPKKRSIYYDGGRARVYAPSTVRHHYFQFKKILQWHSRAEKYPLDPDLFEGLHIPGAWHGKRERRLESGEREAIESAAKTARKLGAEWLLLMRFALATGARAQEIIKAKWSDVELSKNRWNIPPENVKTSTFRQVPLHAEARTILHEMESRKSETDPRVFHYWRDTSTLSKGWRRLTVRAKIRDFHFHDLRHEAICQLFERTSLSDAEIMSITGHTNISTLLGYMRLRPNLLADKIDAGLARSRKP
jgi:integrase